MKILDRSLIVAATLALLIGAERAAAQTSRPTSGPTTRGGGIRNVAATYLQRGDDWFSSDQGKRIITNIITWQTAEGGWAKGYKGDHPHKPTETLGEWEGVGTIDNRFTTSEIRLLARAYKLTKRQDALDSANRGIDFLIQAQYPNGGWPQRFPLPPNYGRYITFNDDAMLHVLELFEEIRDGKTEFAFVDDARREKVKAALERGIDCILKCQIKVNGKLTAWGQQHDPQTLAPAPARSFELIGLSGDESGGLLEFLMRLDHPSAEVIRAIDAGAAWYEASKIKGKRVVRKQVDGRTDAIVVDDPSAETLWARYYEIETNRPFFCGRDGVKKYSLAEIERERRAGYAWLRPWGRRILDDYAKWRTKHHLAAATEEATPLREQIKQN